MTPSNVVNCQCGRHHVPIEEVLISSAIAAIEEGHSRGHFISDHVSKKATIEECQEWSDAYTLALERLSIDVRSCAPWLADSNEEEK